MRHLGAMEEWMLDRPQACQKTLNVLHLATHCPKCTKVVHIALTSTSLLKPSFLFKFQSSLVKKPWRPHHRDVVMEAAKTVLGLKKMQAPKLVWWKQECHWSLSTRKTKPDLRDARVIALNENKGTHTHWLWEWERKIFFPTVGTIHAHIMVNRLLSSVSENSLPESQCGFCPDQSMFTVWHKLCLPSPEAQWNSPFYQAEGI